MEVHIYSHLHKQSVTCSPHEQLIVHFFSGTGSSN